MKEKKKSYCMLRLTYCKILTYLSFFIDELKFLTNYTYYIRILYGKTKLNKSKLIKIILNYIV
jgi:hypothetical protein